MNDLVSFSNDLRKRFIGFNSIFDDLIHHPVAEKYPLENMYVTDDGVYHLELGVAGFSKEDLEIERLNNKLVVRGKKVFSDEEPKKDYIRRNLALRSFEKSFTVSNDFKDIDTELKDGILYIHLEKDPSEPRKRLIEIH